MSLRTDYTPTQLLSVALAVMMLASVGAVAFVGGAAAQTGGTPDQVFDTTQDVSNDLNVNTGSVSLVGDDTAGDGNLTDDGLSVEEDGQITIADGAHTTDRTFAGIEISPDRVKARTDMTADPANQADFLDDIPNEFEVESNTSDADGAFPAIFVEYAPQSEFSQIEGSNDVDSAVDANTNGEHDFIVIANSSNLSSITQGGNFSGNGTVALSVDNDRLASGKIDLTEPTQATVLANGADFGTVAREVTGASETDLQNKNIDKIQFTAGTFGATNNDDDTIQQVLLADDIDNTDFDAGNVVGGGETIHSEQITLTQDGGTDQFFASIDGADEVATDDNSAVITVDHGEYNQLEDSGNTNLSLDTDGLTVETTARTPAGTTDIANRFAVNGNSVSLVDSANESVVSREINVTDDDISISGLVIDDDATLTSTDQGSSSVTDASINLDADDADLSNTIVVSDSPVNEAAVDVDDSPSDFNSVNITESAILEADPVQFDAGDTGLDLDGIGSAGTTVSDNLFVGFETQIDGLDNLVTAEVFDDHSEEFRTDDRTQLAVVENTSRAVQDVDTLFGAINRSDEQATDGDVIAVAPGTYNNVSSPVGIGTNNVVLDGTEGSSRPTIVNEVNLSDSTNATIEDFVVNNASGITNDGASGDLVTIRDVTLPADDSEIDIQTGDGVTVDNVDFTGNISSTSTGSAVNVNATNPDVDVADVTIETLNASGLTGVNITDAGSDVLVDRTTVDFNGTTSGNPTAVNVSGIDTSSGTGANVNITDNTLLNVSNGIGVDLAEEAGGDSGRVIVDGNTIRGGTQLTGINYDLPNSVGSDLTANTIIGADVTGGNDSVGIRFISVTTLGDGVVARSAATEITVTDNVLSGHARIIESQDGEFTSTDYDAILDNYEDLVGPDPDEELNNTVGTLVVGPNGATDGGATYADTYGEIEDTTNAVSYLPGSVNQAAQLVSNNGTSGTDDTNNVSVSTLEVQDPTIAGVDSPNTYDEAGTSVDFPDEEQVSLTGEGSAQAPLIEDSQILIDEDATSTGAINNHSVSDLAINYTGGNAALNVTAGSNSQATFENLNVTSSGTGLNVSADQTDVNVIEVRDSVFDVDSDGIVLADSSDNRDGFVLDNVTLVGPGLETTATGLNLSNVETPGKEELPTELEVRELDVSNFQTQLVLSDALVNNFDALDSEAVYENDPALNSVDDDDDIVFANNNFVQAALVKEEFADGFNNNVSSLESLDDEFNDVANVEEVVFNDTGLPATKERLADRKTIYGSITEADASGVDAHPYNGSGTNAGLNISAVDADGNVITAPSNIVFNVTVDNGSVDTVEIDPGENITLPVTSETAVIDVKAAGQDLTEPTQLYTEDVVVGAGETGTNTTELLVRGPQAGTAATDSVRGDEAFIFGTLGDSNGDTDAGNTTITIDGFTTVTPHEYSVIEFNTNVDRFDANGPERGDFEAGDEFIVQQNATGGEVNETALHDDIAAGTGADLRLDTDPINAPTNSSVAFFDDNRTTNVSNTALSADVSEDRFVVSEDSSANDIDVERLALNNSVTDYKTSAIGVDVDNGSVTLADSFVGDHNAVDTTADSVVANDTVTIKDSTLDSDTTVDVSREETATETTNTTLFEDIVGYDIDASDDTQPVAPIGVNANSTTADVSGSGVSNHAGDGVLMTNGSSVTLTESTTVTNSGARGIGADNANDLLINKSEVSNSQLSGVNVTSDVQLNITNATIQNNGDTDLAGVLIDADLTSTAEINQTTFESNDDSALNLTNKANASNITVRSNAFENNGDAIVVNSSADGTPLDATLNYFGDAKGPQADGGDNVTDNVEYDPFLDEAQTDTSAEAIESTSNFAHDVIAPAPSGGESRTFTSVGFPAEPEAVGTPEVQDFFDTSSANVFKLSDDGTFGTVDPDTEINASDAFVVENRGNNGDRVVSIEYQDNPGVGDILDNRRTFDAGVNFVAPRQAGPVDEVLFPGGPTDAVVQPFQAGENLYGATSADQVRDSFVTRDDAQSVSTNFRSGAGNATVHPHVGYIVIVNEESNEGLQVTEKIPVPDGPTANNIANRTNVTDVTP